LRRAGKSTFARFLQGAAGKRAAIVDFDVLAREVVQRGSPALKQLVAEFGEEILDRETKELDRKKLGAWRLRARHVYAPFLRLLTLAPRSSGRLSRRG
jgi:dephospho-CoA kinase